MTQERERAGTTQTSGKPWEERHKNDGRGPIADNASQIPDRDADIPEGSPGEAPPVTGDGYQSPSSTPHPVFPDKDAPREPVERQPRQDEGDV